MITDADIQFYLSGGATNSSVADSIGGDQSYYAISSGYVENFFVNVTAAECTSGMTDYVCIYVFNDNEADTMYDVTIRLPKSPDSADTAIEFGADPAGAGVSVTAVTDRFTAPSGVTFDTADLNLGTLGPEEGIGLWIMRVVSAGASVLQMDNFNLTVTAEEA
jgi:hypothetical protein